MITATASGLSASYPYDPFGRRYSKTVNGTTTVFVYDNLGKIVDGLVKRSILAWNTIFRKAAQVEQ